MYVAIKLATHTSLHVTSVATSNQSIETKIFHDTYLYYTIISFLIMLQWGEEGLGKIREEGGTKAALVVLP